MLRAVEQGLIALKDEHNQANIGPGISRIAEEAYNSYETKTINYDKNVSKKILHELKTAVEVRIDQALDEMAK
jgi:hypothetical protein